ncbi:MAG: IS21 family transposase [Rhizobacter sp.]
MEKEVGAVVERADTVGVPGRSTEVAVVGQEQWETIRQRGAAGQSVSAIARELGLDRKTVRGCLKREAWKPYSREVQRATLLDEHMDWLTRRAPQVGFSARVLFQELRGQRGFTGCYEVVKKAVRPLRSSASVASITQMRFETAPGEQAQVDWGQVRVWLGGVPTRVHVFVMTLGYSRRGYAEGYLNERMDSLLSAHERAFDHFGGVCQSLLYDRMRTVTIGTSEDDSGVRRAKLNATFQAFAGHWGFTIRLCRPYRAQTKGKVESGVKYIKRNFVPGRQFRDLEDFNAQLAAWQAEIADVREHGTTHQRPIDRFAEEANALMPAPGHRSFLQAQVRERVVAEDWLVAIDANRYSVPFRLIGKTVQVAREQDRWVIRHKGKVVAEHPVLSGRAQLSVQPDHGPGAIPRNQRQRFATVGDRPLAPVQDERDVEVRDLGVYDQLLQQREAA